MDKMKINLLCKHILSAANSVEHKGEDNSAQLIGICRAAREIAAEVNKPEKTREELD